MTLFKTVIFNDKNAATLEIIAHAEARINSVYYTFYTSFASVSVVPEIDQNINIENTNFIIQKLKEIIK